MGTIWLHKNGQAMKANDDPDGLKILSGQGWTTDAPKGWEPPPEPPGPAVMIEVSRDELTELMDANAALSKRVDELEAENKALSAKSRSKKTEE